VFTEDVEVPTEVTTIHFYTKAQDITEDTASRMTKKIAKSHFVIGAKFVSEVVTPVVGSIRLDVVVMTQDHVEFKKSPEFKWFTDNAMY